MYRDFLRYEFLLFANNKISAGGRAVWVSYNKNETKEHLQGVSEGIHNTASFLGKKRASEVLLKVFTDGTFEAVSIWNGTGKEYIALWKYRPEFSCKELANMAV